MLSEQRGRSQIFEADGELVFRSTHFNLIKCMARTIKRETRHLALYDVLNVHGLTYAPAGASFWNFCFSTP